MCQLGRAGEASLFAAGAEPSVSWDLSMAAGATEGGGGCLGVWRVGRDGEGRIVIGGGNGLKRNM